MSSTEIAVQDQAPAPAPAKLEESASDLQFRQLLRRMQVTAPTLARMPGLNPSLIVSTGSGQNKVVDHEATLANVEVVGFTLATYGKALNAINVQQFDMIQGTLTPRCQLQMGIVTELTGHAISLPVDTMERAVAVLVRADNGERHEAEYTVEMAEASGALDFWVEWWADRQGGGRYLKAKIVLGHDEAGALAAQQGDLSRHAAALRVRVEELEWVRKAQIKSLEAWHKYRADMLARRALKRVMRWGAPEVVSGVVSLRERYPDAIATQLAPNTAKATVTVDMGLTDGDDPEIAAMGDRPALSAPGPAYRDVTPEPAAVAAVRGFAARVIRLHHQINALPESWQRPLLLAWAAKSLPILESDDFMPSHLEVAEDVVDKIMAEALRQAPADTSGPAGHAAQGEPGEGPTTRLAETPGRSGSEPARPLAQQIAMQADKAGVDHHNVIRAVTGGEKWSAKAVDAEEGQLVLEAIEAIARGELDLVENKPGEWTFAERPPEQATFDQGEPFT